MRYAWVEALRRSVSLGRASMASVALWVFCVSLILAALLNWPLERPDPDSPGTEPDVQARSARQLHPGLLIERRDEALGRVLAVPADVEAMDSLVRSQRHLAANNPAALRAGASAYAQAASAGAQTSEHYTPRAMRLLVLANLLAATQIETEAGVLPPPRRHVNAVAPGPPPPVRVTRHVPGPAAPQTPTPVAQQPEYFLVVSAPLAVQHAQQEVSRLASAGFAPLLRRTGDGRVQVQVGAFATRANAERLAAKAQGRGLSVLVIRGPAGTPFHLTPPPAPVAEGPAPTVAPSFDQLMERGLRLYAGGWYGPATASFRQAAGTRSGSARAHLWWGRAAFRLSRFQESREALFRTLALSGDAEVVRQARLLLEMMAAGRGVTSSSGVE